MTQSSLMGIHIAVIINVTFQRRVLANRTHFEMPVFMKNFIHLSKWYLDKGRSFSFWVHFQVVSLT